jgi:hypothetical protein
LLVAAIQMRLGLIYGNTDNPHTDKAMALEMLNKALKIRLKKYARDHKVIKEVHTPHIPGHTHTHTTHTHTPHTHTLIDIFSPMRVVPCILQISQM